MKGTRDLEAAGIPAYEERMDATRAVLALGDFARSFRERRPRPVVPTPVELATLPVNELAALSWLSLFGTTIVRLDINLFLVRPEGAFALDAVLATCPYRHGNSYSLSGGIWYHPPYSPLNRGG